MRWTLGLVGLAVAGLGAWQGDDLAAAVAGLDARVSAIEERLTARPIGTVEADGALRFTGGPSDTVSEPFDLPKGTILATFDTAGLYVKATLIPAPGTDGHGKLEVFNSIGQDRAGTHAMQTGLAMSVVLVVEADTSGSAAEREAGTKPGAWSLILEP